MSKPRRRDETAPDEIVFAVCSAFLKGRSPGQIANGDTSPDIAAVVRAHGRPKLTRESIYPLVAEGIKRKYLLLCPPIEQSLTAALAGQYHVDPARVRVVAARRQAANEQVTAAGADLVVELIEKLSAEGKRPVHLGLGAGWTSLRVAQRLAQRMRSPMRCEGLVLHALSSGFDVSDPLRSPTSFFGLFADVPVPVEYVGLFVSAAVPSSKYPALRRQPDMQESFDRAKEVDIVVTSLASADDAHGALNRFLGRWQEDALDELGEQGWVGDVLYMPYSTTGPIKVRQGMRAVTLFELSDLVAMAASGTRYVVLLGGPCGNGECARTKTQALRPLLREPTLRVFTHLVLDAGTASELLRPDEPERVAVAGPGPAGVRPDAGGRPRR